MNKSYQNMRAFWADATNVQTRSGTIELGPDKIVTAGVEMAFLDGTTVKHVFIATNSLGDTSFYFENNSPSGLGGMLGGHANPALQEAAARMLAHASKLTAQMTKYPPAALPGALEPGTVRLFAVSKENVFETALPEAQVRNPENPFYPMFAYSQQVIGQFKEQTSQEPPKHA